MAALPGNINEQDEQKFRLSASPFVPEKVPKSKFGLNFEEKDINESLQ